jgi:hypothetical protein
MDPNQAHVLSVDVLERMAVAMIRCHETLSAALLEAESEVDRAEVWIERERLPHWRKQVQRRDHEVQEARSALFRKENHRVSTDSKPSTVDERKALARAVASKDDADQRARASQRWCQDLAREHAEFRRGITPLSAMVDRDLPAAIAALKRMAVALERYGREQAVDLRRLVADSAPGAESTRRTGDASPEAPA